ncbi:MAG: hypothetical protein ACKESB_01660 [Candidatus Hodgkinia cicadicola]
MLHKVDLIAERLKSELLTLDDWKTKSRNIITYEMGWSRTVRSGNTIIGTDDAAALGAWIENLEIEIFANEDKVVVRMLADSTKLAQTSVGYFVKTSSSDFGLFEKYRLVKVRLEADNCVYELHVTKAELVKLRLGKTFYIELLDEELTTIEFESEGVISALVNNCTKAGTVRVLAEQKILQQNLRYNLLHKAKTYMRSSSLKDDLVVQFETLKTRLVNEINLPSLAKQNSPRYKSFMQLSC